MRLKGADMVMECLLEQGVETVFGYPGGAILEIYDSLYKYRDKIQSILTSHEHILEGQYLKYMIVYINIGIKYSQYLHLMNRGHLMQLMDMRNLLEK